MSQHGGQPCARFASQVVHRRTARRLGLPAVAFAGEASLSRSQSPGWGFDPPPPRGPYVVLGHTVASAEPLSDRKTSTTRSTRSGGSWPPLRTPRSTHRYLDRATAGWPGSLDRSREQPSRLASNREQHSREVPCRTHPSRATSSSDCSKWPRWPESAGQSSRTGALATIVSRPLSQTYAAVRSFEQARSVATSNGGRNIWPMSSRPSI